MSSHEMPSGPTPKPKSKLRSLVAGLGFAASALTGAEAQAKPSHTPEAPHTEKTEVDPQSLAWFNEQVKQGEADLSQLHVQGDAETWMNLFPQAMADRYFMGLPEQNYTRSEYTSLLASTQAMAGLVAHLEKKFTIQFPARKDLERMMVSLQDRLSAMEKGDAVASK
jgi:hypothetical protein